MKPSEPTSLEILTAKAMEHKAKYPTFDAERLIKFAVSRGKRYVGWAASQPIERVNKSFRFNRSLDRLVEGD